MDNKRNDATREFGPTLQDVRQAKERMQVINSEHGPENKKKSLKKHKSADH